MRPLISRCSAHHCPLFCIGGVCISWLAFVTAFVAPLAFALWSAVYR